MIRWITVNAAFSQISNFLFLQFVMHMYLYSNKCIGIYLCISKFQNFLEVLYINQLYYNIPKFYNLC